MYNKGYAILKQYPLFPDFGIPELMAFFKLSKSQIIGPTYKKEHLAYFPVCVIEDLPLDHNVLYQCLQRMICINHILIALAEGPSLEDLTFTMQTIQETKSFRVEFISIGVKLLNQQEIASNLIKKLNMVNKVDLVNPDIVLYVIVSQNRVFIGLQPWPGIPRKVKGVLQKFELSQRIYLGPVTLQHELAFLMCNVARLQEGDLVLDPFCGTCSILIAATYLGAHALGTEIDKEILIGTKYGMMNKKSSYYKQDLQSPYFTHNFEQYNLKNPDLVIGDASIIKRWRPGTFDAIVTDPPFGIRTAQLGQAKDFYTGFLQMCSVILKPGGWLCFLIGCENEIKIPCNDQFNIVDTRIERVSQGRLRILCLLQKNQLMKQNNFICEQFQQY